MEQSVVPDEDLAIRVAYGDTNALTQLYDRYSQQIFAMAAAMLRDRTLAEDLSQEVFVALWTRARTFQPGRGPFKHWFLHLAHNRIVDQLRRQRRQNAHSTDRTPEDVILGLESSEDTADAAVNAILSVEAAKALVRLPQEQRAVLTMAYMDGATQQEIAKRTGVPLGTVKTRIRLGMIKLRHLLVGRPERSR